MCSTADAKVPRRLADLQVAKENIRQQRVIMLTCMGDQVLDIRRAQRSINRSELHELRPCADDAQDSHNYTLRATATQLSPEHNDPRDFTPSAEVMKVVCVASDAALSYRLRSGSHGSVGSGSGSSSGSGGGAESSTGGSHHEDSCSSACACASASASAFARAASAWKAVSDDA